MTDHFGPFASRSPSDPVLSDPYLYTISRYLNPPPPSAMTGTFTYEFDTPIYKGSATIPTGLFINGQFVDPVDAATIE
jgi:hypothetical protein